ncbi:MAG: AAA family ATPase [Holosporales bacterium]|jgi:hypothetical protein|nr:AAA family ATPase [Holosporales bacterium]
MDTLFTTSTSKFETIINGDYIYVDKTDHIYNLIKSQPKSFLCRPRRFGKSLLVDTLDNLFSGRRDLFSNLWINSSDYSFDKFPVIRLDFSRIPFRTSNIFASSIVKKLKKIATIHKIKINSNELKSCMDELISKLCSKFDNEVVILIDEYDAPLLDFNLAPKVKDNIITTLRDLYSSIKALDNDIFFIFVTGITQISRTIIGQSASNLKDISISDYFSSICGFTISEMDKYFGKYYDITLQEMINKKRLDTKTTIDMFKQLIINWYDGYNFNFDPTNNINVLNPVSIKSFFFDKIFSGFWVQSGPSSYLSDQIKNNPSSFIDTLSIGEASERNLLFKIQDLTTLEVNEPAPLPLLFQSGYLTLNKDLYDFKNELRFGLKFPNLEVTYAWQSALYQGLFTEKFLKHSNRIKDSFLDAILSNNESEFELILSNAISSLIYNEHPSNEKDYQRLFHILFVGWDLEVFSHLPSPRGISDLEIALDKDTHAVIELKYLKPETGITPEKRANDIENTARRALKQIVKKTYGHRGGRPAKTLIRIGLVVHECDRVRALFSMDGSIPEKPRRPRRPKAAKTPPST